MAKRNQQEERIREQIRDGEFFGSLSGSDAAVDRSLVEALQRSIRTAIGGRSPREVAAARTGRALRRGTGVTAMVWALLVCCTFFAEDFSESSSSVVNREPDLVLEEESLLEETDESTVLSAMLGEGLNP